ncbi:MAG: signal peptide peptidase SppA [Alphaproteobacteria bacterium]|nr:signal peptide peptidase SppA [Alphaproteobacteria bacterium]
MQPISDLLIDRKRLKARLAGWRMLALFAVFGVAAYLFGGLERHRPTGIGADYIAQITIADIMVDDVKRDAMMKDLLEDDHAKAVLVQFDSPGGTTVGGETIYLQLKEIAAKKPVVGVMRTLCASACYMASLGTDHVVAREGTLTGSIGVLLQSFEVSRLADKLGITPITVKSGAMKDVPSIGEPFTESQRAVLAETISDAYGHFVRLIVARRKMDEETVRKLADGRVYTGNQAFGLKLIDGIGGTDEALRWLREQRKISPRLKIQEIEPEREISSIWETLAQSSGVKIFGHSAVGLDGLVSIWHPSLTQ